MSFPNRGEGGGGPPFGKNSPIFPFFFLGGVPKHSLPQSTAEAGQVQLKKMEATTFPSSFSFLVVA